VTDPLVRCRRGHRCRASVREGDTMVGAPTMRPLCDACEAAVDTALHDTPGLYVALRNATLTKPVVAPNERVGGSIERPLPLNSRALDLGEQLWWVLCVGEDDVRRLATNYTEAQRWGKREGRQVQDAAEFLAAHLTAWCTNRPDDAGGLIDLCGSVRRFLDGRVTSRSAITCPACKGSVYLSKNGGHCAACGKTWTGIEFIRMAAAKVEVS